MHPRLRDALGNLKPRFGLEGVLRGTSQPEDAVLSFEANPCLYLAPIRNATPTDRLAPVLEHLNDFLHWAGDHYDLLVMDCPSILSQDWSDWFHEAIGPALLVVRHESTSQVEVKKAVDLLGSKLKCAVLNRVNCVDQEVGPSSQIASRRGSLREMSSGRGSTLGEFAAREGLQEAGRLRVSH